MKPSNKPIVTLTCHGCGKEFQADSLFIELNGERLCPRHLCRDCEAKTALEMTRHEPWTPDDEDEKYVAFVGRMALDALASNGVKNKSEFVSYLRLVIECLEEPV